MRLYLRYFELLAVNCGLGIRDWPNPLFGEFSYCCAADSGPHFSVNQLYNNQEIGKHEDLAIPCSEATFDRMFLKSRQRTYALADFRPPRLHHIDESPRRSRRLRHTGK